MHNILWVEFLAVLLMGLRLFAKSIFAVTKSIFAVAKSIFAVAFYYCITSLASHDQYHNSTPMVSKFKRISVFCGSSSGKKPCYQLAAVQLANQLVERKIDLVYGGGSIGLMGLVSQAVYDGGRHVLGVIPNTLMPKEITGEKIGEVMPVSDMHKRKAEMARQADAFIALPGGYGTLEELLEVITWAQLRIHDKPVGLLNVDGYYDLLLSFMDKAVKEGFISPYARRIIVSAPTAHELMSKLEVFDYLAEREPTLAREFFLRYASWILGFLCLFTNLVAICVCL